MENIGILLAVVLIGLILLSIVFGFYWVLCNVYNYMFKKNYSGVAWLALMSMLVTTGLVIGFIAFLPEEAKDGSWGLLGFIAFLISPFMGDAIVRGVPAFQDWLEQW